MKIYIKPSILCMAFMNQTGILAGSEQLPKADEEGDDENNYSNKYGRGRNQGSNTWDDFEEEEDY